MAAKKAKKKGSASASGAPDAIAMLKADHAKVKKLFARFGKIADSAKGREKTALVAEICDELTLHTKIEEEIFYGAVRKAIKDGDLMDEALVEHSCAKSLIAQLQKMDIKDDLYNAKVTVLGEQIDHHVKEEENDMFPKAKRAKLDTQALGEQMARRKAALMQQMGISPE